MRRNKRPTIIDVANRAGVSQGTASRVVNGQSTSLPVAAETRARVLAAAEELGYRPNRLARGLVTKRTNIIGLSIPVFSLRPNSRHRWTLHGISAQSLIEGVMAVAYAEDYEIILFQRQEFAEESPPGRFPLGAEFVEGVIIAGPGEPPFSHEHYKFFRSLNTPMLLTGGPGPDRDVPYIGMANENTIQMLTRAFLQKGHLRIGLILPTGTSTLSGDYFRQGYLDAYEERGLSPDERLIVPGLFDDEAGARAAGSLVSLKPRPTAIIVGRTDLGCEVLEALKFVGVRCPEDVEIVVWGDDANAFETCSPRLSAIWAYVYDAGKLAAERLIGLVRDGVSPPSEDIHIPWRLTARDSCALENWRASPLDKG